jgi:hypothetical protein
MLAGDVMFPRRRLLGFPTSVPKKDIFLITQTDSHAWCTIVCCTRTIQGAHFIAACRDITQQPQENYFGTHVITFVYASLVCVLCWQNEK